MTTAVVGATDPPAGEAELWDGAPAFPPVATLGPACVRRAAAARERLAGGQLILQGQILLDRGLFGLGLRELNLGHQRRQLPPDLSEGLLAGRQFLFGRVLVHPKVGQRLHRLLVGHRELLGLALLGREHRPVGVHRPLLAARDDFGVGDRHTPVQARPAGHLGDHRGAPCHVREQGLLFEIGPGRPDLGVGADHLGLEDSQLAGQLLTTDLGGLVGRGQLVELDAFRLDLVGELLGLDSQRGLRARRIHAGSVRSTGAARRLGDGCTAPPQAGSED